MIIRAALRLSLSLLALRPLAAQEAPITLPTVVVAADRLPDSAGEPFSNTTLGREALRQAPQLRLDDVLRHAAPGFSLFRRTSSRVAHPTAQGVSLRNLGPNGAGRTLVLLDGIPLNDPFAGWVPWARVSPAGLQEVIIQPGGGAGLFGNAALAGTIHLRSEEGLGAGARAVGTVGDRDTHEASLEARIETEPLSLAGLVQRFATGGYPVLQADQRGPVDTSADAASWMWQSRLGWGIDAETRVVVAASGFEEERNNGTRLTRNSSEGQDFSATLDRAFPASDASLRLQSYVQRRQFRSTFSAINLERTVETLALDQFDVPATAAGGSAVWSQQAGAAHRVVGGADVRWVEGETRENFLRVGDELTRYRHAGGRQLFIGAFLEEHWRVSDATRIVAGGRVDYWRQYDGERVERERSTGATLRDSRFAEQDGVTPNGRLGFTTQLARSVRLRSAAYTGFRVPTLNELYRPFRVGNDITEANPALEPEQLYGAELGLDWEPVERFSFAVTGFYNQLHHAVANVTIAEGPGTFDSAGFVPAGGVLRQRRNLDRVDVPGVEVKMAWQVGADWRLRAQYLYTHPTVTEAPDAPQLEGKLLPQAPEHLAVVAIEWMSGRWRAGAQVRYVGRQFEDDQNTLSLAAVTTADLSLGYSFTEHVEGSVRVENFFDAAVEVGRTANGLVSIGTPRLFSLTMAMRF